MLLTIGYHQLEGKRMELKKPFAVLDRVSPGSGGGSPSSGSPGGSSPGGSSGGSEAAATAAAGEAADVEYKVGRLPASGCCLLRLR